MDSSAYLTRHGWRGDGHGLHPGGIKKPLLVSKKSNVLGLGKKKNDVHADQWWARAFDSGLKGLEINQGPTTSATPAATSKSRGSLELMRLGGGKWTGLYSSFVKGQGLTGTYNAQNVVEWPGLDTRNKQPFTKSHKMKLDTNMVQPEKQCIPIDDSTTTENSIAQLAETPDDSMIHARGQNGDKARSKMRRKKERANSATRLKHEKCGTDEEKEQRRKRKKEKRLKRLEKEKSLGGS